MALIERDIAKKILGLIDTPDIIVIHGARQVGKTSLMKYIQNILIGKKRNTLYIDLEDFRYLGLFDEGAQAVINYLEESGKLSKKLWLFVDEIQYLKNPSNFLKMMRDHYGKQIKLLVSGSSSFEIKSKFRETLVGRLINFELYPLSFSEFLKFKNEKIITDRAHLSVIAISKLKDLYREFIIYGGYPRIVLERTIRNKELYLQQIIDTYIRKDIRDIAGIRDISKFNHLLEVMASQSGKLMNVLELSNTAKLSRPTVEHYLFIMENTYVLKTLRPFSHNLRSELFKTPKIYFCDTGIANLLHYKTFPKIITGESFETSVFMEFVKAKSGEELFYWRTQDGKEIDFIIRKGAKIMPVEVKLSSASFKSRRGGGASMNFFMSKYHLRSGAVISLDTQTIKNKERKILFKHPWSAKYFF